MVRRKSNIVFGLEYFINIRLLKEEELGLMLSLERIIFKYVL
jgi:hypothetical protein